jgi:predicted phosphodiesterase
LKVAALYDVHAMPLALETALRAAGQERADVVLFGGDLIHGPCPRRAVELARGVPGARFVRGNCEREPDEWVRSKLDAEAVVWLQSWPATVELDGVLYCHSTPADDMPLLTDASAQERFDEALDGVDARLVVAGHTHMQFTCGRYVNAGSVGMPYEDEVAAFWALISDDVEFRKTTFDVERAAAEIRASGWPDAEEFVAENLLVPPSRAEATAHFESLV